MLSVSVNSKKRSLTAVASAFLTAITNGAAVIVAAVLLVAASPVAKAQAADLQEVGIVPPDGQEMDAAKREACDCCQKCKAAKRPIESAEETPAKHKNGCEDCCRECGKELKPSQQDHPPEVIEKQIPPEVIERKPRPE